jgi:hypothetical protein
MGTPPQLRLIPARRRTPVSVVHPCPTTPPAQRSRLTDIRDNLITRIDEAEREGWLGEVEGLRVSLAGAQDKLAQMDRRTPGDTAINLGMPGIAPAQPIREEGTAT